MSFTTTMQTRLQRGGSYRVYRAFLGGYGYGGVTVLPGPQTPTSILDVLSSHQNEDQGYGYDYTPRYGQSLGTTP